MTILFNTSHMLHYIHRDILTNPSFCIKLHTGVPKFLTDTCQTQYK